MSTSHESSLLSTAVSILDGSNYLVWKNQMRAWLRSKGLWQITNGNEKKFQELDPSAPAAAREANYKQRMDWDNKDDQAYGTILLRVNPSVAVYRNKLINCQGSMGGTSHCLWYNRPLGYLRRLQKCDL